MSIVEKNISFDVHIDRSSEISERKQFCQQVADNAGDMFAPYFELYDTVNTNTTASNTALARWKPKNHPECPWFFSCVLENYGWQYLYSVTNQVNGTATATNSIATPVGLGNVDDFQVNYKIWEDPKEGFFMFLPENVNMFTTVPTSMFWLDFNELSGKPCFCQRSGAAVSTFSIFEIDSVNYYTSVNEFMYPKAGYVIVNKIMGKNSANDIIGAQLKFAKSIHSLDFNTGTANSVGGAVIRVDGKKYKKVCGDIWLPWD